MKIISFDTETHRFRPGCMSPRLVCLTWDDGTDSGIVVGEENLRRWFDEHIGHFYIVGHHLSYDFACAIQQFPEFTNRVFDAYDRDEICCTQIRERLLDIAEGEFNGHWEGSRFVSHAYTLEDICKRRLNKQLDKNEDGWRTRYDELENVPLAQWPKRAVDYALDDARSVSAVFDNQEKRATRLGYRIPTQFEDSRACFALKLASNWGVETDYERVCELSDRTKSLMTELSDILIDANLARRDKSGELKKSLKTIQALVKAHYPGEPQSTPKGSIKTGKEVLMECEHPALEALVNFNSLQKANSTYIEKLFQPVIHSRFWAVGAESDRTSSSDPNLQNQPRLPGIRECFKARPGRVFLASDFDSQEMRTLAQTCLDICGKSKLAERYQKNTHFDPHLEFAAQLMGITTESAKLLKDHKDETIKERRQQAKAANFGYPGGMGSSTFRTYAKGYGLKLTLGEADHLRTNWFRTWPEMSRYFDIIRNMVGSAGVGTQVIPRSGFRRGNVTYTNAANGFFQTLAAHSSKRALWNAVKKCFTRPDSYLYGSRPAVFIHDEIVLETPELAGHEAAKELEQTMVESMQFYTPDVPAAASATLMRRWSKRAESVYEDGRLVPWEEDDGNDH